MCQSPQRCFIRISKILLYAIHNIVATGSFSSSLFYQDFKDTFVCNTQQPPMLTASNNGCFIRISKILLYAIHNFVVMVPHGLSLFYQDFKDTFVCNTQQSSRRYGGVVRCFIRISKILLYAIHNLRAIVI